MVGGGGGGGGGRGGGGGVSKSTTRTEPEGPFDCYPLPAKYLQIFNLQLKEVKCQGEIFSFLLFYYWS